jgi:uncharacterized membrane protein
MDEAAIHLIIAAFDTEAGAEEAIEALKESRDEELIGIQAAVAVRKDEQEQIHFQDVGMTPGKGAVAGVVLGAVVGVLTGGTALALGAVGALIGGLVGKKKQDSRFPTDRLNRLAASLEPGSSAVVIVMEPGWVVVVEKELETLGGHVLTVEVPEDVAEQLKTDPDAAYAALSSELGPVEGSETPSRPAQQRGVFWD